MSLSAAFLSAAILSTAFNVMISILLIRSWPADITQKGMGEWVELDVLIFFPLSVNLLTLDASAVFRRAEIIDCSA